MPEKLSVSPRSWSGFHDTLDGLKDWRLWLFLGAQDIRQRYARSYLGPFWLVMGLGITIIGIGFLYSQIMKTDPGTYLPFIAISLAAWNFISGAINDSTVVFQANASLLKSVAVPYSTTILRSVTRNFILLAHYMVAVIITYLWARFPIDLNAIFVIPGLIIVCANLCWISLALGMLCARFRDMAQMAQYALQLAQFATPIIWQPSQVAQNSPYLLLNPIYHLVELLRAPIFEHRVPTESLFFSVVMFVIGGGTTTLLFHKFKRSINFWL
jgi:ABC-type polysaccharide/polyol phosphate export permease